MTNIKQHHPTIDELITLHYPSLAKSNHDGSVIAYTVRTTNWNKNRYEHKLYIKEKNLEPNQLTKGGDVTDFHWYENSLYVSSQDEEKPQIWLYENLIGEPTQLTDIETGVQLFKPHGKGILFIADDPDKDKRKHLREKYGNVTHFEQEESSSTLYYTSIQAVKKYNQRKKSITEDEANKLSKPIITITKDLAPTKIIDFHSSNKKQSIYINTRAKDPLVYFNKVHSYQITLDPDEALESHLHGKEWTAKIEKLGLPEMASVAAISPEGDEILVSHRERDNMMYTLPDLWRLDVDDIDSSQPLLPSMKNITKSLDKRVSGVHWTKFGIFVVYVRNTVIAIAKVELDGQILELDLGEIHPDLLIDISQKGYLAFVGANAEKFPEVHQSSIPISQDNEIIQITDYGNQVENWDMGTVETIQWESKDGTIIEGVLRKPSNFDPNKKYPLLFDVHGGPSWFSREVLLEAYDYQRYPVVQFNNKGVLILKPNYRGSIGRGQAFLELNVDNLGVGDLWDVESAIDHLDKRGFVDTEKVGCMGWSQGGYISAFVGLQSTRFQAVCVGAGISDWYTYHISNDMPYFTDHYLSANPWEDPEIYKKTAPMSNIQNANTPMLIQHGAKDMRVPLSNAMELYRALQAKGIPVEMFIYPEMAHPITKPRENRSIMQQNLDWFSHYLLGEKLDFSEYDQA